MIACCGINCHECEAFEATRNDDDLQRAEVARRWSEQFNAELKPEDINCEGCQSNSDNLFSHCNVCEIRKCSKEKKVENCAYCDEYHCEKLDMVFTMLPDAKRRLDELRSSS